MQGDIKRTAQQREKLLVLLSKDVLDRFWDCSLRASRSMSQEIVEEQYVFIKRVCQVLVHLGISQLGPLWVRRSGM